MGLCCCHVVRRMNNLQNLKSDLKWFPILSYNKVIYCIIYHIHKLRTVMVHQGEGSHHSCRDDGAFYRSVNNWIEMASDCIHSIYGDISPHKFARCRWTTLHYTVIWLHTSHQSWLLPWLQRAAGIIKGRLHSQIVWSDCIVLVVH